MCAVSELIRWLTLTICVAALCQAQLEADKEYTETSNPHNASHRHLCRGFHQLATLKGEWVDHTSKGCL